MVNKSQKEVLNQIFKSHAKERIEKYHKEYEKTKNLLCEYNKQLDEENLQKEIDFIFYHLEQSHVKLKYLSDSNIKGDMRHLIALKKNITSLNKRWDEMTMLDTRLISDMQWDCKEEQFSLAKFSQDSLRLQKILDREIKPYDKSFKKQKIYNSLYIVINNSFYKLTGNKPYLKENTLKELSGEYKEFFFDIMKIFRFNPNDNMVRKAVKVRG